MEASALLLGVLLLLLAAPRAAFATGRAGPGVCFDWWDSSEGWVGLLGLGDSQCPARPRGDIDATHCRGLCHSAHYRCGLDNAARPAEEAPLPAPVSSGAPSKSDFFSSSLILILPGIFLLLFCCAWLWMKDDDTTPRSVPTRVAASSSSSSAGSQLRSHLPSSYGSFSMSDQLKFTKPIQDSSRLVRDTPVRFFQQTGKNIRLSPVVHWQALEEQGVIGGPPEEGVIGGPPEEGAIGGPPEEDASGRGGHESKLT